MDSADPALTLRWPWLVLPALGPIRIATIVAAIAIGGVVLWRRRSPLLALVAVMGWAAAYEIAFNALGTVVHGWSGGHLLWLAAALAGWVVLARVAGVVPDWRWTIAAGALALAWILTTGFAVNSPATADFSPLGELFNETTKVVFGVAYLLGALRVP